MSNNRYLALGLSDNPFPPIPRVDLASRDPRMNGSIYDEEIFSQQLAGLRQRLDRGENLVYAQNTKFVVGVGKSALITREYRRLRERSPETAVYIRCGRKTGAGTIDEACTAIVDIWSRNGTLWKAFRGILSRYGCTSIAALRREGSPLEEVDQAVDG